MTVEREFFTTPDWAIDRLCEETRAFVGCESFFEPCVGDGAIVARFRHHYNADRKAGKLTEALWGGCDVFPYEFREGGRPDMFTICRAEAWEPSYMPDAIVTNPPFSLTLEILQHCLPRANKVVAFLTRITWLESQKRNEWLRQNMPSEVIYMPRRFRGPNGRGGVGNDSAGRAWLVWEKAALDVGSTKFKLARY